MLWLGVPGGTVILRQWMRSVKNELTGCPGFMQVSVQRVNCLCNSVNATRDMIPEAFLGKFPYDMSTADR